MAFFSRRKYRLDDSATLDSVARESEIRRLEAERDRINADIEKLMIEYTRITGDKKGVRGARRIGKSPKDMSYYFKDKSDI